MTHFLPLEFEGSHPLRGDAAVATVVDWDEKRYITSTTELTVRLQILQLVRGGNVTDQNSSEILQFGVKAASLNVSINEP